MSSNVFVGFCEAEQNHSHENVVWDLRVIVKYSAAPPLAHRVKKYDLLFLLHLSCYDSCILDHQLHFQIQFIPVNSLCCRLECFPAHPLMFVPGEQTRQKDVLAFKIKCCWFVGSQKLLHPVL